MYIENSNFSREFREKASKKVSGNILYRFFSQNIDRALNDVTAGNS